jgi:RNA ligase
MKYSLELLKQYEDKGWLTKQDHPTLPLSIYNYSRGVQYEKLWDPITLECRGLILDSDGTVVGKSFPKFFNYEELVGSKWEPGSLPEESFEVYEKMDGSLGIVFHYEGEWHLASKGSFTSEQAIEGRKLLEKYSYREVFIPGHTYLCEIIYPSNRIVVDYEGREGLVFLGIYENETCKEVSIEEIANEGFELVKRYDGIKDVKELKSLISGNQEGFVIRYENGMRMKIKGEEYVRLHRILTDFSNIDIWEYMKDGKDVTILLNKVPDEFDKWIREQISAFMYGKQNIIHYCGKVVDYFKYGKYGDREVMPTKKEFVEHLEACGTETKYRPIMYSMWDGKPYEHLIWKLMKPKYQKPFWQSEEKRETF